MIRLIVAADLRNGIGKNGHTPWDLPKELAYFHKKTDGGNVLMGSKTYSAIGRPLSGRQNFVASRKKQLSVDNINWVTSAEEFIKNFDRDLWVIGGQQIYELALPNADEIYLTRINFDFDCDRFFPVLPVGFKLASRSKLHNENGLSYVYEKWVTR